MALNESPEITLVAGGAPVQVNIAVTINGVPNTALPLSITASQAPQSASIAAHPNDPRAVIITPGNTPVADLDLFVNTSPGATNNLRINVKVEAAPQVVDVSYVSHGPVQP